MISNVYGCNTQANQNKLSFKAKLTLRGCGSDFTKKEIAELTKLAKSFGLHKDDAIDVYIGGHNISRIDEGFGFGYQNRRDASIASYLGGELRAHPIQPDNHEAFCEAPYNYIKNTIKEIGKQFLSSNKK